MNTTKGDKHDGFVAEGYSADKHDGFVAQGYSDDAPILSSAKNSASEFQFIMSEYMDPDSQPALTPGGTVTTSTQDEVGVDDNQPSLSRSSYLGEEHSCLPSCDTRGITGFGLDITPSGSVKIGAKKRNFFDTDEHNTTTTSGTTHLR